MFSLDRVDFAYEPYPIGYAAEVFPPDVYDELVETYPGIELFEHKPELGDKYSLSEKTNRDKYERHLKAHDAWSRLHAHIKSDAFILDTLEFLRSRDIDLGLRNVAIRSRRRKPKSGALARISRTDVLSARFEFSMMGGQGGHIRPHTDDHRKLVTFVLSMVRPGEWDSAWGGGTQVCLPKNRAKIYNQMNRFMEFDEVDILHSYDFRPNQCILFVKTYNSWHQVAPLQAPAGAPMRKTLTVNIEKLN